MTTDQTTTPADAEHEQLERESDITFFTAGGPGGQHRNRVATGVRLLHRPTGIVVTATERRSQAANRAVAFERLAERLAERNKVETPRVATRPSRAAKRQRLEGKQRRASVKQARRSVRSE